jgi:hypothetical protein
MRVGRWHREIGEALKGERERGGQFILRTTHTSYMWLTAGVGFITGTLVGLTIAFRIHAAQVTSDPHLTQLCENLCR